MYSLKNILNTNKIEKEYIGPIIPINYIINYAMSLFSFSMATYTLSKVKFLEELWIIFGKY
jgi:hypothetical protein